MRQLPIGVLMLTMVALIAAGGGSALSGRSVIVTFAGTGGIGAPGDGGPATKAHVGPIGIAVDGAGNVYFSDNGRIRKVDTRGTITTIAGGGDRLTDGPVLGALLAQPFGLAFDADGSLYFTEGTGDRVRKLTPDGRIITIAGRGFGHPGYEGDGGPATLAALSGPDDLVFDKQGNLYVADSLNSVIRKITPGGTISTFAGGGGGGRGDGGPATKASLDFPQGLALDAKGNLYVAEYGASVVRKITPGGTISTFAGGGVTHDQKLGDGGPATKAFLSHPTDVAVGKDGSVYIADWNDLRIRKVTPDGKITTIAGPGVWTHLGDGGPAAKAYMSKPISLAFGRRGDLFVTMGVGLRVREIKNAPPIPSFTITHSVGSFTIRLDASASRDPDGTIFAYVWTFSDGTTGTGKRISHTFARAGSYRIVLHVTDDDGATTTKTRTVKVG